MENERVEVVLPKGSKALIRAMLAALSEDWTEERIWVSSLVGMAKQISSRPEVDSEARALIDKRLVSVSHSSESTSNHNIATDSLEPSRPSQDLVSATTSSPTTPGSRDALYNRFWSDLLEAINAAHDSILGFKLAPSENWLETPTGRGGFVLTWSFGHGSKIRCELYFDTGDRERNKRYFDLLQTRQSEIETQLGPLSWERLDRRKGCRIAAVRDGAVEDTSSWTDLRNWAIERHMAFRQVFIPLLNSNMLK